MDELHGRVRAGRQTAWTLYLAAGAGAIVAYLLISVPVRHLVSPLLAASATAVMLVGIRRNRPHPAAPWYLFTAGMGLYTAADVLFGLFQFQGTLVPFPSAADVLYLAAYPFFTAGLITLTRVQSRRLRWAGLLDAGIITLGAATLAWAFIIAPYLGSRLSPLPLAVSLAYPVADLVLLCMATRLVLTTGTRTPSFLLVTAWLGATLSADALYYSTLATTGAPIAPEVSYTTWMASYLFMGAAALHPSLVRTAELVEGRQTALPGTRLVLLILLAIMGPVLVIVDAGDVRDQAIHVAVISGIVACLTLLLVLRVGLLAQYAQGQAGQARTRAEALERSLREQRSLQNQLSHQAFHDPLTGLSNRTLLSERLEHVLSRPSAVGTTGLLLIDLDRFKDINDSLGHPVGDEVLIAVGHRLLGGVRRQDTVARLGGDEFAVLVEELRSDAVCDYAQRLLDRFKDPFALSGDRSVYVTASIGIVAINEAISPSESLRAADLALYVAKEQGRNRAVLFEPSMSIAQRDQTRIAQDLRYVLTRNELTVYYQPVVELDTGETTGAEALIRWEPRGRAPIPPEHFIPIAEETGLILPIGAWILRQACRQARRWHDNAPTRRALTIAVNVSGRQFKDPLFPETVTQILCETGFPASSLVLEITENVLIADAETTATHISALRSLGVRVSIDDFGTGYSSLSYLRNLPVDIVKIDQSFVNTVGAAKDNGIIQAILHLSHALGVDTIAEGIETSGQADRLRTLGCPHGQGFYYAEPMTAHALDQHLTTHPTPELHHPTR
ncbi:putative bifunctional diguanylate cyclase/phosphodiesterase [Streptomyces sp. NPDC057136]|uniref:putative bifunctional diguanylate cyclase/phosphodiesterase n=1 Tax=Streptomyces sp. NPDC057136 TaxID=3346029 RepID=UPI00362D06EE